MNKKVVLKCTFLLISIILIVCALPQKAIAAHSPGKVDVDILEKGSKIKLKKSRDYTTDNDNNILCMNVNRHWASETKEITFTVRYKLHINGKKATVIGGKEDGKSWNSVYNAQLAYILNSNGTMGEKEPNGYNNVAFGSKRQALWLMIEKWIAKGGEHINLKGFSGGNDHTSTHIGGHVYIREKSRKLLADAKEYANSVKEFTEKAVDKRAANRVIKKTTEKIKGVKYDKFGPFRYDVGGKITSIDIKSINTSLSTKDSRVKLYQDETIKEVSELKNNKDFYILINPDVIDAITGITINYKVSRDDGCTIVLLEDKKATNSQNLLVYETKTDTQKFSDSFTYKTPLGNIEILKKDTATGATLKDVVFTLKMTSGEKNGQYVKTDSNGNAIYTTNANDAKIVTNEQGKITIKNLWRGNYELTEVHNPHPGYESLPKVVNTGTIIENSTVYLEVTNKKQFINIEGIVWIDKSIQDKNGTYNYVLGSEDNKSTEGIKVYLVKNNGTRVETTTNSQGKYYFNNVSIDDIINNAYHIEYVYNGIKYQSVPANVTNSGGTPSRASDITSSRNALNSNFSTINSSNANNANNPNKIRYNHDAQNYKSTVIYDENQANKNAGREADYITQVSQSRYNVTASTSGIYNLKDGYDPNNLNQSSIQVNFGLIERIQPDLAVTKDVQNVKVSVKEDKYNQLYTYGERVHQDDLNKKFNDNLTYTRNVYASDIAYGDPSYGNVEGQTGKQIDVKVTYKIGLKNKTSLNASINKLRDFYSAEYGVSGITIGKINEQTGEFTETYNNQISVTNNSGIQGYNKLEINKPFTIAPNKTEYIYVQLTVPREALKDLLNNAKVKEIENFVEIEEYTTRDEKGNLYGGIDKNSQPGNMIPENKSTYEDDNDKAPSLKIGLKAEREMSGNVFLDETSKTMQQGQERQGDGIYKEGEKLVNVEKVELYEIKSNGSLKQAKVFNKDTKTFTDANLSNISGYNIKGFLPGRYVLKYTWGNGETTYYEVDGQKVIISSQKYKGTIFKEEKHQGEDWYTKEVETRYTDATDDYERRKQIDAQTSKMTNKIIRDSENANNAMTSQTPIMNMNLEYGSVVTISYAKEKQSYVIENGQVKYDQNGYAEVKEGQEIYKVRNVDFGIVERARQELKLDKYVQHITIFGTDGNRLVDAERNAEGKLETTYLTYISAGPSSEAQIKVELDKEIMQNSNINIVYNFKITNIGEVDYANEQYYKYGNNKNPNDIVRLKPERIIDYVDDTIEAHEANNSNWEFIENDADKKELVENLGLIEKIEQLERTKKVAVMKDLMDTTTKGLAPGEVLSNKGGTPISITSSKLMTTSNDGLESQNFAEIIEVIRNGEGSVLYESVLGNYDIENYKAVEPDSSYSERIIVIPATGENRNYALYTIIGISSLAVIAVGIVLIKKKTIK